MMIENRRETNSLITSERVIELSDNTFVVDAALIGELLQLPASEVPILMRAGSITSACEQGVDEHAGQFRLSFFYRNRRARLSTDADGRVLRRTVIDFGARPIAQSHHQSTAGSEKLTPAAQQQGERT